ncbi:FixH family protein [Paenibacillus senegalimassiliensis]|uniref:FixH family protein n=1 Tax=Paenibacillus senegalimassiliensis TaxID=1737426 RepID=UPI00073F44CB|nr:FixH family protein [Paenibacillus senegalimassiliensis]
MKRSGWLLAAFILTLTLLGGCARTESTAMENFSLAPIKVQLEVTPDPVQIGETVTFTATVTHQEQIVDDADEVTFEFWREDDTEGEHGQVTVTSAGNGTYVLEQSFDEPGTYKVISHVTARDQHSMPSKSFTVQ